MKNSQQKISQQKIVDTALALVDEQGLDELSMRALAKRLGVQASALYWYIGDKEQLLCSMATSFYARALAEMTKRETWREWLLAFGFAFRSALLSHRDSARLCAIAQPVDEEARQMHDQLIASLVSAGLDRHTAFSYLSSVIALSLGGALGEQSNAFDDIFAEEGMAFAKVHTTGLSSMIAGFPEPARRRTKKAT